MPLKSFCASPTLRKFVDGLERRLLAIEESYPSNWAAQLHILEERLSKLESWPTHDWLNQLSTLAKRIANLEGKPGPHSMYFPTLRDKIDQAVFVGDPARSHVVDRLEQLFKEELLAALNPLPSLPSGWGQV